ncbi:MAG TPA: alpha/beta hydrolase, partial [Acidimicrobiales bacterium]|nr:alpha/beta hydrolase [Acidimicrobiales bacterium]
MERFDVVANGLTFSAMAEGPADGRPVVFLHGFPQTSWSWHRQIDAAAADGYRAFAFDQRGYSSGARPPHVEDYRIDALVADVLAVADTQGMDRFDLVGHDWGAMVAWVLAARHPERIRTLTAVSVPHPAAFG